MAIVDTISSMYENVGEVYDTITNVDVNNGTNLLDYSTCKIGDLNTGTGAEETSTVRIISDFIEVTPNENYICTLIGGDYTTYYYSSNKAFISGGSSWIGSGNSFTTPNNTGYLRLKFKNANNTTISLNDLSNVMLNKGTTALPYQPYTDNPTYKNIENIPKVMRSSYLEIMNNGIDKIWNNWEKVEGTGETITLNSTEEAPITIDLKGNTSQETTTGKNLLDIDTLNYKPNNYTITKTNDNYKYTVSSSGTWWQTPNYKILNILPNTQYTYSFNVSNISITSGRNSRILIDQIDSNEEVISISGREHFIDVNSTGTYSKTFTTTANTRGFIVRIYVEYSVSTANTFITLNSFMIEKSATATSYEPYTNGASPNPDYPQDIHVVSGDNSIDVVGKNLWGEEEHGGIDENTGVDFYNATRWRTVGFISAQPNTSYTISSNASSNIWYIFYYYDKNKNFISSKPLLGTTSVNWETPSNCKYMRCVIADTASITTTQRQLEKGSTATTYEAYTGASYPISLGVENLLDESTFEIGSIDAYTGQNVANNTEFRTSGYIEVDSGTTYTLSNQNYTDYTYRGIFEYDSNKTYIKRTNDTTVSTSQGYSLELGSTTKYVRIRYIVGHTISSLPTNMKLQYEKGSKANSYTPYGTTPIELCKIGTYQDSIKKSTGKNLFDKDNVNELNATINSSGVISSNNNCKTIYIPIKPNTTYTMQKVLSTQFRASVYDEEPQINSTGTNTIANFSGTIITITSTTNSKYLALFCYINTDTQTYQQILDSIMINEGSTALPYEPYGKVWYVNKQIGKYTITGQESSKQYYWSSEINGIKFALDDAIKTVANAPTYCNRFNQWYSGTTANNYVRLNRTTSYTGFWFGNITIEGVNSIATFKSYATNNQVLLYYPLATPTYTEITDTTLLSQLEAVKKSYTTQTNISQENNDKPFILDVTALKQLTQ